MTQKCYNQKIDVWSLGCTFAELAVLQNSNQQMISNQKSKSIFKGTSCFPLSPRAVNLTVGQAQNDKKSISKNDQLVKILQILPTVKKCDLESFSSEACKYVRKIQ